MFRSIELFVSLLLSPSLCAQIQSSFFGMATATSGDMPKVSYGFLTHPPLAWTAIEGTARGTYNFNSTDGFVKRAPKNANGVAMIDIVFGWTPGWALADQSSCTKSKAGITACTAPPDSIQDWADFVTAVIGHYNGKTAPHVAYYEIWNEANTVQFFSGTPAQLAQMAQIAYPILKSDPYAMVLTPSVVWLGSTYGTAWASSYFAAGGLADGVTFHGYPSKTGRGVPIPVPLPESSLSTNAPIQSMIAAFREMADSSGMIGKPLLTTEGGWGVNGVIDPDMQTAWITHYEIVQAGLAASENLLVQSWFTWGKAASGTIETSTGTATAAGAAYNIVHGWLLGQEPQPCTSAGNIWSCALGSNLAIWDESQICSAGTCTTSPYNPLPGYSQYLDVTNTDYLIDGPIALGVKPILLEP